MVKLLARDRWFMVGVSRRHMKTIGYLRPLDRMLGVTVTTRNWNTMSTIAKMLES